MNISAMMVLTTPFAIVLSFANGNSIAARASIDSIHVIPIGSTDHPLPNLTISNIAISDEREYYFNDVVSSKVLREVIVYVHTEICHTLTIYPNRTLGPWATVIVEERASNGNLVRACRIEKPAVKKLVSKINEIYSRNGVSSPAIIEWGFVLKRGY